MPTLNLFNGQRVIPPTMWMGSPPSRNTFLKLDCHICVRRLDAQPRANELQKVECFDCLPVRSIADGAAVFPVGVFEVDIRVEFGCQPPDNGLFAHCYADDKAMPFRSVGQWRMANTNGDMSFTIEESSNVSERSLFHKRDYMSFSLDSQVGVETRRVSPNDNPALRAPGSCGKQDDDIVQPSRKLENQGTEGTQQLTAAYHQYAAFLIEDALEVQSYQDLEGPYTKKIGYALARAIDVTLAALVASLTNSKGTLGNELTQDDYLDAQLVLAQAGLLESSPDPGADFSVFLTPAAYNAALKTEVFINKDYNGAANAIQAAQVGNIYGFTVFRSNLLTSNGAGHDCVMMHRGCFALAKQKALTIKTDYLIERSGQAVMGYNIYGVAELNYPPETAGGGAAVDNRGVWLKTL